MTENIVLTERSQSDDAELNVTCRHFSFAQTVPSLPSHFILILPASHSLLADLNTRGIPERLSSLHFSTQAGFTFTHWEKPKLQ